MTPVSPSNENQRELTVDDPNAASGTKAESWHFITCEYPPKCGGVADHSAMLASAIADRNVPVTVWHPPGGDITRIRSFDTSTVNPATSAANVHLEPLNFGFSWRGLLDLNRRLSSLPSPKVICIHYVPHGYGYKAMNVLFALWVYWRSSRGDDIRILFHEVIFPWVRTPLRQNVLAVVTRIMAFFLVRAARSCYVTIPGWRPYLWAVGASRSIPIPVVPVPSMVPLQPSADVASIRETLACDEDTVLIGHFGTYGSYVTQYLEPIVTRLALVQGNFRLLFLGHGGEEWLEGFLDRQQITGLEMSATGPLALSQVAEHLAACDIMIQPYPDGASYRRTSLMASLQHGKAVVTSVGMLSEPTWSEGATAVAQVGDVEGFVAQVARLIESREYREELSIAAIELYRSQFAIEHTVDTLLARI